MDILSAILACSFYRDDALVRAIAETNSHGNPYAVVDATLAASSDTPRPEPRSLGAAVELTTSIASLGGFPLLGLMQVPASWAIVYGKQPSDLFNPCINIMVGTAKLSDLDYECGREERLRARKPIRGRPKAAATSEARRHCVMRKYAQAIQMQEFELVLTVELEHQRPANEGASIFQAPIVFEGRSSTERLADADRLLFNVATDESALVDPFAPAVASQPYDRGP
jgi:hypothetical protein